MDNFDQSIFLKELFNLQKQQASDKDFSLAKKFGDDFIKGFSEDNPYVKKDTIEKIKQQYSEEDIINFLKDNNIDIVNSIDEVIGNLAQTDVSHAGHSIDGSFVENFWENLKTKYEEHKESEDINNL
ncbi:MAG: hypothetical protein EBY39_06105 [Flavobacteriia bacterium]|nr:hypothetical protein [Flavobacteriia bacterium]